MKFKGHQLRMGLGHARVADDSAARERRRLGRTGGAKQAGGPSMPTSGQARGFRSGVGPYQVAYPALLMSQCAPQKKRLPPENRFSASDSACFYGNHTVSLICSGIGAA